ncbi:MAG: hypothetical protein ABSB29_08460 [Nitrososphaerales archaeon]|jgi:hypothetical protein
MLETKSAVLFAIVSMIVVIGIAASAVYTAQPGGAGPQTSTTTTSTSTISTQSGSAGSLLVRLELSSSRIIPAATVGINVSDYNPSSMELNLAKETAWALGGLSIGGCPSLYYPFGIAVFRGMYSDANISQAVPLRVFPVIPCPTHFRYITGYLFQPMSDDATVLPGMGEVPMAIEVYVSGMYNMTGNQLNVLMPFTPGVYTVAASDEWGDLAFAYFVVVASS